MKIYIGQNFEVWNSGVVVGNPGETIAFELDKGSKFIVYFEFAQEGVWGGNIPILHAEEIDENSLLLRFDKYSNSQGHGNIEPLEVGIINNRRLYLNYRIFSSPKGNYHSHFKTGGVTLMYTWLLGGKHNKRLIMDNTRNVPALQESIENNNNFIRYNPERIDYSISEAEIDLLSKRGQSYWKDVFFIAIGVALPSISNLLIHLKNRTEDIISIEIFINSILIFAAIVVGLLAYFAWKKDEVEHKEIIDKIKNKPLHVIPRTKKENDS